MTMHDYQNLFEYYDINHAFHYILSNYIMKRIYRNHYIYIF